MKISCQNGVKHKTYLQMEVSYNRMYTTLKIIVLSIFIGLIINPKIQTFKLNTSYYF